MRARCGSGSGTRARVRVESRNDTRASDECRVSHGRAIRSKSPAETPDGPRNRRVFASFVPRDEALTLPLPRVMRDSASAIPERKRAPCGSIERGTPGSSARPTRRTSGEASNANCTTDGRCVQWLWRVFAFDGRLKPKAKVRFFRVKTLRGAFFTARKDAILQFAPTRGFFRLDAH